MSKKVAIPAKAPVKNTLGDLRALHDRSVIVPNRIREALALLRKSGRAWMYETDFVGLVKPAIGNTDMSKYRAQFERFWTETPATNGKSSVRKVWFATEALRNQWLEEIGSG